MAGAMVVQGVEKTESDGSSPMGLEEPGEGPAIFLAADGGGDAVASTRSRPAGDALLVAVAGGMDVGREGGASRGSVGQFQGEQ